MSDYHKGTKNEILERLVRTAQPSSPVLEQMKMAIFVRCTEDLEASMSRNAESANKLAKKVWWLNLVLALATAVLAAAAVASLLCP